MFRRRTPLSLLVRLRNQVWPAMGLRRTARYWWLRLHRISDTPSSIASGVAIGFATAVSPLVGTHLLFAFAVSWALRANFVAAIAGSWLVNPWTAPPIWFATYYAGRLMQGLPVVGEENAPNFVDMFKSFTEAIRSFDFGGFGREVWPVLKPMLLGTIPIGLVSAIAIYVILRPIIATVQTKRRALRMAATTRSPYDERDAD